MDFQQLKNSFEQLNQLYKNHIANTNDLQAKNAYLHASYKHQGEIKKYAREAQFLKEKELYKTVSTLIEQDFALKFAPNLYYDTPIKQEEYKAFLRESLDNFGTIGAQYAIKNIKIVNQTKLGGTLPPEITDMSRNLGDEKFQALVQDYTRNALSFKELRQKTAHVTAQHSAQRYRYTYHNYANRTGTGYYISLSSAPCAFCLIVASNGIRYRDHKRNKSKTIRLPHGNCRCKIQLIADSEDIPKEIEHISDFYDKCGGEKKFRKAVHDGEFTRALGIASNSDMTQHIIRSIKYKSKRNFTNHEQINKLMNPILTRKKQKFNYNKYKTVEIKTKNNEQVKLDISKIRHTLDGERENKSDPTARYTGRNFIHRETLGEKINGASNSLFVAFAKIPKDSGTKTFFDPAISHESAGEHLINSFKQLQQMDLSKKASQTENGNYEITNSGVKWVLEKKENNFYKVNTLSPQEDYGNNITYVRERDSMQEK